MRDAPVPAAKAESFIPTSVKTRRSSALLGENLTDRHAPLLVELCHGESKQERVSAEQAARADQTWKSAPRRHTGIDEGEYAAKAGTPLAHPHLAFYNGPA